MMLLSAMRLEFAAEVGGGESVGGGVGERARHNRAQLGLARFLMCGRQSGASTTNVPTPRRVSSAPVRSRCV